MNQNPRRFTLEEANALIPILEATLGELMRRKRDCERLHDFYFMNELLAQKEETAGIREPSVEMEREAAMIDEHAAAMHGLMERLRRTGCCLRHWETGRVEFLSEYRGESVFLCWGLGEKRIRHYRRPCDETPVEELALNGACQEG